MSLSLENAPTDIFTDFDESITGDGSIDPLGLLIIWTSLGNRIFHNRLNSISTNIRSYTLNLFHHSVIRQACKENEERFFNLVGKPPYDNTSDLHEGLAIFLECLMSHIILQKTTPISVSEDLMIPGVSKLNALFANQSVHEICKSIPVNRNEGILVRQHQLGVHGRHKGPFQQMNLFQKSDYYNDTKLWNDIDGLFVRGPLAKLKNALTLLIGNQVLSAKVSGSKHIRVKVSNLVTPALAQLYQDALQESIINAPAFSNFWKDQLGLSNIQSPAGKIYKYISAARVVQQEDVFHVLATEHDDALFKAINTIEPFISMIQKIMERLLTRGQAGDKISLEDYIKFQFDSPEVDVVAIYPYLRDEFLSGEAIVRLRRLMTMFESCLNPFDPQNFIRQLIEYHDLIMKRRGNISWISVGNHGNLTQHRTFSYSEKAKQSQDSYDWVNSYYLPTVIALHKGMSA